MNLATVFIGVLRGLEQLHSIGFVHRDIKPENIGVSLSPPRIVLTGFTQSLPVTDSRIQLRRGTRGYYPLKDEFMKAGDTRFDLYAVGVCVAEVHAKAKVVSMGQEAAGWAGRYFNIERKRSITGKLETFLEQTLRVYVGGRELPSIDDLVELMEGVHLE